MAGTYANNAIRIKLKKIIHASGIMDGHAHNNSGATCPMPLIYSQIRDGAPIVPESWYRARERSEFLVGLQYKAGVQIQKLTTVDMGDLLATLNKRTFAGIAGSMDFADEYAKKKPGAQIATPVISATMDMERAHIEGYSGQTIYHQESDKLFYFRRASGELPESSGKMIDLSHEIIEDKIDKSKALKLKKWRFQFADTVKVARKNPLHILPLIFYDPRRYNKPSGTVFPETKDHGAWNEIFNFVATEKTADIWLGIKMYPPLGHKPFDEMCEYLPDFYHQCERDKIPILVHCSPGGMTTHEAMFYREYDRCNGSLREAKKAIQLKKVKSILIGTGRTPSQAKGRPASWGESTDAKDRFDMDYFFKWYVHPEAWRPVLENFPDLHLCLAHFGGDEWMRGPTSAWNDGPPSEWIKSVVDLTKKFPNVYTDLSCFNLASRLSGEKENAKTVRITLNKMLYWMCCRDEYKHLKHKVIFGTDWYLTHLTRSDDSAAYGDYCRDFKQMLDKVDPTFWIRFTLVNPWMCYSMTKEKIDNMAKALKHAGANGETVSKRQTQLNTLDDEVSRIKEQLLKWDE